MSDAQLKEAQAKYAAAKAWGQEQSRAADQARRELKQAQDAADQAASVAADLEAAQIALAAANARISDLTAEVDAADKRAKKNAVKAESFDAIKSALGI